MTILLLVWLTVAALGFVGAWYKLVRTPNPRNRTLPMLFFAAITWPGIPFALISLYLTVTVHTFCAVLVAPDPNDPQILDDVKRWQYHHFAFARILGMALVCLYLFENPP